MQIQYNDSAFRALFPAFAYPYQTQSLNPAYTTANIQQTWNTATLYINDCYGGCYAGRLSLAQQTQALNLMTAHLLYIQNLISTGEIPGIVTGATIDKVSITLEPPPAANQWQYWLQSSPYGQQLLAMLQNKGVGGFYITSGIGGRSGFRGGVW